MGSHNRGSSCRWIEWSAASWSKQRTSDRHTTVVLASQRGFGPTVARCLDEQWRNISNQQLQPSNTMPTHKLSDGFVGWPKDAVTLNGIPMPTHKLAMSKGEYEGPWVLVAPNNRAVDDMGSRRPYVYNDIEEMEAEVRMAVQNNGCSTCVGTLRLRLPGIKDVTQMKSPKAMAKQTVERQREAKKARGEFVPEPVIDKRKGAKTPEKGVKTPDKGGRPPKKPFEQPVTPTEHRSTKDVLESIINPLPKSVKPLTHLQAVAALLDDISEPFPGPEVEASPAVPRKVQTIEEVGQILREEVSESLLRSAIDSMTAHLPKLEPVVTPKGGLPVPAPTRKGLSPIVPDIAIPLVFRDCQTVKGDGKTRKMMTWLQTETDAGARIQLTCGAGAGSPELYLDITHGGRDLFLVANIDAWIQQVVNAALRSQGPSEITVLACLLNDHGIPYYIQLAGDLQRIRKLNNQLWCAVLPHTWYPDVPMPKDVSDNGLSLRTVLVQEGVLAIRTHMYHPADDKVGLPEVALAYLRGQGLPV
jgi:hypothetical protein